MIKINNKSEDLEVVYQAPDEITADMVHSFLVAEGIPAVTIPRKNSRTGARGRFFARKYDLGDIAVPVEYADQSREIIEAYLTGVHESPEAEDAK